MSGGGRDYHALNRTHQEVEGERSPHRNYEALRETHREVDARPAAAAPERPQQQNPYERREERIEAKSKELDALVASGRINQSERIRREARFDNQLLAEMRAYDQRLEKARQLRDAAGAQQAQQPSQAAERGGRER